MPARRDFCPRQGNTFVLPVQVKFKDSNGILTPLNMTGGSLVFYAKWTGGSIRRATGDAGFLWNDITIGKATLTLNMTHRSERGGVVRHP